MNETSRATEPSDIEKLRQLTIRRALKLEIETGMKRSSRGRPTTVLANEITGKSSRTKREAYKDLNDHIVKTYGNQYDRPLS